MVPVKPEKISLNSHLMDLFEILRFVILELFYRVSTMHNSREMLDSRLRGNDILKIYGRFYKYYLPGSTQFFFNDVACFTGLRK